MNEYTLTTEPTEGVAGGLRQGWIDTGPHDDGDGPAFAEASLDCGAGLGTPYLHFTIEFEDGTTVREHASIAPVFEAWVDAKRREHAQE